jgi:ketosteroid isomerase-like protein
MPDPGNNRIDGSSAGREEREQVRRLAEAIADAIARKDADFMASCLAPGFVHRSPGGEAQDATAFVRAIRDIPVEILSVRLEMLEIDVAGAGALATGIQHARVRIDGAEVDDRRAFVDWFVRLDGEWRLRVAVDLPEPEDSTGNGSAGRE